MAKINIKTPTGTIESLNVLSAFRENSQTYVILDSGKMGSMGLPIIYVSKYTTKLESIPDENEWSAVKNYLRGIVNGTNFEYVKIADTVDADEAYYKPLTLPQASFDLIRNRYVVEDSSDASSTPTLNPTIPVAPQPEVNITPSVEPTPVTPVTPQVEVAPVAPVEPVQPIPAVQPVSPVIPDNHVASNMNVGTVPLESNATQEVVAPTEVAPIAPVEPVLPQAPVTPSVPEVPVVEQPVIAPTPEVSVKVEQNNAFMMDKETFLRACENMFDALLSKYQKELANLEAREEEIKKKEAEINTKMASANEALANAQAREQVANIAHDNAQKVMDLQNFMPNNPNGNETGVL